MSCENCEIKEERISSLSKIIEQQYTGYYDMESRLARSEALAGRLRGCIGRMRILFNTNCDCPTCASIRLEADSILSESPDGGGK